MKRLLALFLALVYSATQVVFASSYQAHLWKERKSALKMASLPVLGSSVLPVRSSSLDVSLSSKLKKISKFSSHRNLANVIGSLPQNLGTVRQVLNPAGSKIVIHIQDIHQNQEAQENIEKTVQELVNQKYISLVVLEGAFGPIDIQNFRDFPDQASVRDVVAYYKEKGVMTGPMVAAFTSPVGIPRFFGVDHKIHYDANVQAYKDALLLKENTVDRLNKEIAHLETAKTLTFSSTLLTFDKQITAYHADQLPMGEYVTFLARVVGDASLNIEMFLQALRLERELDFKRVEREREQLLTRLTSAMSQTELSELMSFSVSYRMGRMSHVDFYTYLQTLTLQHGVPLTAFPAMNSYIKYMSLSGAINAEGLTSELSQMEKQAYDSLARTDAERDLIRLSRQLSLTKKITEFSLSSAEWQEYKEICGLSGSVYEKFYLEAEARDGAMASNLLDQIGKTKSPVSVLVTGGFHSAGIGRALAKNGVALVSFTPRVTRVEVDGESKYLSFFTQEKTPLEKLFEGSKLFVSPPVAPDFRAVAVDVAAQSAMRSPESERAFRSSLADLFPQAISVFKISVQKINSGLIVVINGVKTIFEFSREGKLAGVHSSDVPALNLRASLVWALSLLGVVGSIVFLVSVSPSLRLPSFKTGVVLVGGFLFAVFTGTGMAMTSFGGLRKSEKEWAIQKLRTLQITTKGIVLISENIEGVVTLQMNRPAVRNALDLEMKAALYQAIERLEEDEEVKAIVLGGDRTAFSAGNDWDEFLTKTKNGEGIEPALLTRYLCERIALCKKPVIAAVEGAAVAGGNELAVSAFYRVSSKSAKMGQVEILFGLMPGAGGTQRLTRLIGPKNAALLNLSGSLITGAEARKIGLVDEVVDAGGALSRAQSVARHMVQGLFVMPVRATENEFSKWKEEAVQLGQDPLIAAMVASHRDNSPVYLKAALAILMAIAQGAEYSWDERGGNNEVRLFREILDDNILGVLQNRRAPLNLSSSALQNALLFPDLAAKLRARLNGKGVPKEFYDRREFIGRLTFIVQSWFDENKRQIHELAPHWMGPITTLYSDLDHKFKIILRTFTPGETPILDDTRKVGFMIPLRFGMYEKIFTKGVEEGDRVQLIFQGTRPLTKERVASLEDGRRLVHSLVHEGQIIEIVFSEPDVVDTFVPIDKGDGFYQRKPMVFDGSEIKPTFIGQIEWGRHVMSLEDGTEVRKVESPDALPESVRPFWKNHDGLFILVNKTLGYAAFIGAHRFIPFEGTVRLIGGTRMIAFNSPEDAAQNALFLSQDMSRKVAMAGLLYNKEKNGGVGGGKVAIYYDPQSPNKTAVLKSVARAHEKLELIFTGQDMNISPADAITMARIAPNNIIGPKEGRGGIPPTPPTAEGVYLGMEAGLPYAFPGSATFDQKRISVQGAGGVGGFLIRYLLERTNAVVTVSDKFAKAIESLRSDSTLQSYIQSGRLVLLEATDYEKIYDVPADIFSPCATQWTVNENTIPRLISSGVKYIAGSANDQIRRPQVSDRPDLIEHLAAQLHEAGVLIAPDYVINAGGLMGVASQLFNYDVNEKLKLISQNLVEIFEDSKAKNISPVLVADNRADELIDEVSGAKRFANITESWKKPFGNPDSVNSHSGKHYILDAFLEQFLILPATFLVALKALFVPDFGIYSGEITLPYLLLVFAVDIFMFWPARDLFLKWHKKPAFLSAWRVRDHLGQSYDWDEFQRNLRSGFKRFYLNTSVGYLVFIGASLAFEAVSPQTNLTLDMAISYGLAFFANAIFHALENSRFFARGDPRSDVERLGDTIIQAAAAVATHQRDAGPIAGTLIGDVAEQYLGQLYKPDGYQASNPVKLDDLVAYLEKTLSGQVEGKRIDFSTAQRIVQEITKWIGRPINFVDQKNIIVVARLKDVESLKKIVRLGFEYQIEIIMDAKEADEITRRLRTTVSRPMGLHPVPSLLVSDQEFDRHLFESGLHKITKGSFGQRWLIMYSKEVALHDGKEFHYMTESQLARFDFLALEDFISHALGELKTMSLNILIKMAEILSRQA